MKVAQVQKVVAGLCCMTFEQATAIIELILENGFRDILELGYHHGVSME